MNREWLLSLHGTQFLLYLINEEEVIFEPLEDQVLQEIFGVDLRVSDVRSAIFANPFLDGRTHELSLAYSGAKYVVNTPRASQPVRLSR